MSMPWFRLYAEFATDPKIQALAFEDQRHFIALLCLKCNGTLDSHTGSEAFRERMIAVGLGLSDDKRQDAKQRLLDAGLIDNQWQPIAWEKRQRRSDQDPTGAERQRRWRDSNALRNGRVTLLDTDIETDKTPLPPEGGFSDFWTAYPKKIRKAAAMRAWLRKGLSAKAGDILAHLTERVRSDAQWLAEGGKYIPHPATWLNGDGWLDEYVRASERGFVC